MNIEDIKAGVLFGYGLARIDFEDSGKIRDFISVRDLNRTVDDFSKKIENFKQCMADHFLRKEGQ